MMHRVEFFGVVGLVVGCLLLIVPGDAAILAAVVMVLLAGPCLLIGQTLRHRALLREQAQARERAIRKLDGRG
jgi:hypothetical protein